jgi:hypothetical protein
MGPIGAAGPNGTGFAVTMQSVTHDTAIAMPANNSNVMYFVAPPFYLPFFTPWFNVTLTLPPAASAASRMVTVTRVEGGLRGVLVAPQGSDTIAGAFDPVLLLLKYSSVTLVSDGHQWVVLALR